MKHAHAKLIAQWHKDNSTEFEFAYGTGVDFTWVDCDITHVIKSPSAQIRVKDKQPKKEKRWIGIHPLGATTPLGKTEKFVSDIAIHQLVDVVKPFHEWQFIEIEVEV